MSHAIAESTINTSSGKGSLVIVQAWSTIKAAGVSWMYSVRAEPAWWIHRTPLTCHQPSSRGTFLPVKSKRILKSWAEVPKSYSPDHETVKYGWEQNTAVNNRHLTPISLSITNINHKQFKKFSCSSARLLQLNGLLAFFASSYHLSN